MNKQLRKKMWNITKWIVLLSGRKSLNSTFLNSNSNFRNKLLLTEILKFCFNFFINGNMTALYVKACVTFFYFLSTSFLSYDVLKMKSLRVFNKESINFYKKKTELKQQNSTHVFGRSDSMFRFIWQLF